MNSNLIKNENLLAALNWRYAVKKFDAERKISGEDWEMLKRTLLLTPTSYGLQPYKFIIITDQETKEKLVPTAWGQKQISDCSHLVVIAAKTELTAEDVEHYINRVVEVREVTRESQEDFAQILQGFTQKLRDDGKTIEWATRQAYIALGFLLEAAALIQVDSCPMEGFLPDAVNEVLDLKPQNLTAAVLCPLGYRAADDWLGKLAKVRLPENEILQHI